MSDKNHGLPPEQKVRGSNPLGRTTSLEVNNLAAGTGLEATPLDRLPAEFIRERRYLHNVSAKTIIWYECSFKAFEGCERRPDFIQRIAQLRERGVSAISVNTYLRCINAYLNWKGADFKLPKLKEEQRILETLSPEAVRNLVGVRGLKGRNLYRAWLVALTICDTGLRASEVLGLTKESFDLDNMVIKVIGKGGKHRMVPFSTELRRSLYKSLCGDKTPRRLFGTKNDTAVSVRNLERDFKILGEKVGITGVRFSPHVLRHTFACEYLRRGGNLEFLRRILGHSSISTTQRYLRSLGIDDLGKVHSSLSPLNQMHTSVR